MTARLLRHSDRPARQRGSMAIEVVILAPVLIAFTLLVVAGGRFVGRQGDVDSAARDAARAASVERTAESAESVAATVAAASLPAGAACDPAAVDTSHWAQGGSVGVTIRCQVSYSGLGLVGLPGSARVEGSSVAPLDQFRRTG
jgi:Flp pilus assembly protein TadG